MATQKKTPLETSESRNEKGSPVQDPAPMEMTENVATQKQTPQSESSNDENKSAPANIFDVLLKRSSLATLSRKKGACFKRKFS